MATTAEKKRRHQANIAEGVVRRREQTPVHVAPVMHVNGNGWAIFAMRDGVHRPDLLLRFTPYFEKVDEAWEFYAIEVHKRAERGKKTPRIAPWLDYWKEG